QVLWEYFGGNEKTSAPLASRGGFRGRQKAVSWHGPGQSGAASQNLADEGNIEVGLVEPTAGVRRSVPALQRDRADVVPFFLVENFEKSLLKTGANLGRGSAKIQQPIVPVVKDRDGAPTLGLGFGLIEHRGDPPWSGKKQGKSGISWHPG